MPALPRWATTVSPAQTARWDPRPERSPQVFGWSGSHPKGRVCLESWELPANSVQISVAQLPRGEKNEVSRVLGPRSLLSASIQEPAACHLLMVGEEQPPMLGDSSRLRQMLSQGCYSPTRMLRGYAKPCSRQLIGPPSPIQLCYVPSTGDPRAIRWLPPFTRHHDQNHRGPNGTHRSSADLGHAWASGLLESCPSEGYPLVPPLPFTEEETEARGRLVTHES